MLFNEILPMYLPLQKIACLQAVKNPYYISAQQLHKQTYSLDQHKE